MLTKIFCVDAFTNQPFKGNPAGVVISSEPLDSQMMQRLAEELQHSETAFVCPIDEKTYLIRWFTPTQEAALCGHATLAASHALWNHLAKPSEELVFESMSGKIVAHKSMNGIEINLPTERCEALVKPHSLLNDLFADDLIWSGSNRMDYLVEVSEENFVAQYEPNFEQLTRLGRGLILTARSTTAGRDFVCRVFAPSDGIPEDPVTGSAFCALAPYWSDKLKKNCLLGAQLSKRGGLVSVKYLGARTQLFGEAVTIYSGELHIA